MKFLRAAFVAVLIALLAWIVHLAIDEPLSPEARALVESAVRVDVSPGENAFYFMHGFQVEPGTDAHAFGRKRIESLASGAQAARAEALVPSGMENFCEPIETSCHERFVALDLAALRDPNTVLWARYHRLLRYAKYEYTVAAEHLASGEAVPRFPAPLAMSRLALAHASQAFAAARADEALSILEADLAFWRRLVADGGDLVTRMAAASALDRGVRHAAELLRRFPASAKENSAAWRAMLVPLTADELAFERTWQLEFAGNAALIRREAATETLVRVVAPLFFKVNATLNLHTQRAARVRERSALPARELASLAAADAPEDVTLPSARLGHNSMGRRLFAIATPRVEQYPLRLHNLDALLRLARVGMEILAAGASGADIPTFLDASDIAWRDPYRGAPIGWDGERGVLVVDTFDVKARRFDVVAMGIR